MIGNSLRTDVVPALTAGINSIYIKQRREWQYNLVELKQEPHNVLYTVSALTEVPEVIEEHLSNQNKPNRSRMASLMARFLFNFAVSRFHGFTRVLCLNSKLSVPFSG